MRYYAIDWLLIFPKNFHIFFESFYSVFGEMENKIEYNFICRYLYIYKRREKFSKSAHTVKLVMWNQLLWFVNYVVSTYIHYRHKRIQVYYLGALRVYYINRFAVNINIVAKNFLRKTFIENFFCWQPNHIFPQITFLTNCSGKCVITVKMVILLFWT